MITKCPECGNDVSDAAVACPSCGFSVGKHIATEKNKLTPADKSGCVGLIGFILLGCALICGIGLIKTIFFFEPTTLQEWYADSHGMTQDPGYERPASPEEQQKSRIANFSIKGFLCLAVGGGCFASWYVKRNKAR